MFHIVSTVTDLMSLLAFAGGGGSGGGGGGGSGGSGGTNPFILGAAVLVTVIVSSRAKILLRRRRERMAAQLAVSAAHDSQWDESEIMGYAQETYFQYQKDWEAYDLESMWAYMSDAYYGRNELMIEALKQARRRNAIQDIRITNIDITRAYDSRNDREDTFSAEFSVTARDILIDTRDDSVLSSQEASVVETYNFIRQGKSWLLDSIDQGTAVANERDPELQAFAARHDMYYSLDWGRLLLPRGGSLFAWVGNTETDVNNHCLGRYNGLLVQIYSYWYNSLKINRFVVAQIALPKSYGRIVVRRKGGKAIRGLRRVTTEWNDFTRKYDVFASDAEQATSFELLNPAVMARLEAYEEDINIEVVDNTVYLYTKDTGQKSEQYETMFAVLETAYKELRI